MSTGIVAFSFGKRVEEPNPVNVKLAEITNAVDDELQQGGQATLVVVQWEIARALPADRYIVVTQEDATNLDKNGNLYLDSQDVLSKAFEVFRIAKITNVVVVANPFIHLQVIKSLVKKAGFTVVDYKMPYVGFDNSPLNLQWWCKGPLRTIAYLGIQVIGKLTKQNFHGIWEKENPPQ